MKENDFMLNIDAVIENLLSPGKYKKYFTGIPCKKSAVKNVLALILEKYISNFNTSILEQENLKYAVRESVKSYTRDKKTAIAIV